MTTKNLAEMKSTEVLSLTRKLLGLMVETEQEKGKTKFYLEIEISSVGEPRFFWAGLDVFSTPALTIL